MPISSEVLTDVGIVMTVITGSIDDTNLINVEKALGKLPGFEPDMMQLVDASGVMESFVTLDGLQKVVEVTPFNPGTRRAYVVSSEDEERASLFSRLAAASQSDLIYITRSRDDALNWLMEGTGV